MLMVKTTFLMVPVSPHLLIKHNFQPYPHIVGQCWSYSRYISTFGWLHPQLLLVGSHHFQVHRLSLAQRDRQHSPGYGGYGPFWDQFWVCLGKGYPHILTGYNHHHHHQDHSHNNDNNSQPNNNNDNNHHPLLKDGGAYPMFRHANMGMVKKENIDGFKEL